MSHSRLVTAVLFFYCAVELLPIYEDPSQRHCTRYIRKILSQCPLENIFTVMKTYRQTPTTTDFEAFEIDSLCSDFVREDEEKLKERIERKRLFFRFDQEANLVFCKYKTLSIRKGNH